MRAFSSIESESESCADEDSDFLTFFFGGSIFSPGTSIGLELPEGLELLWFARNVSMQN